MFLMVLSLLTLTACSKPEPVVVYKYKEVKVPVKCKIPDVYCDFNKPTYTEVISSLVTCIADLKRASEVCK